MAKLNEKKRIWIVRRWQENRAITWIAQSQQVSRQAIYDVIELYKQCGMLGLNNRKPGRPFEPLNAKCYGLIVGEWKRQKCGSVKLKHVMDRRGFGVSQRKIQQVLNFEKLTRPVPKRRGRRKYKAYEVPFANWLWHTDYSICPFTGKHLLPYIDDCSRFAVACGLFARETTRNALDFLYKAIAEYGVPHMLMSDCGSVFYTNKRGKKQRGQADFEIALEHLGIVHQPKKRDPQSNGKVEYFHGIYKREFDERFSNLNDFVKWYNFERLSQAIDYQTPAEVFFKKRYYSPTV